MTLFELVGKIVIKNQEANAKLRETSGQASDTANDVSSSGNKMISAFKAIGGAVATFLAVDKIISFGKACVESAAVIKAQTAQFEAAFEGVEEEAEAMFASIADGTGVLATRLKVVGTGAFSQFKGAGLETADALEKTKTYTELAADAAAYYDMSLEEADRLMRSFIRGNTEAGDRIGLFTSESQRNAIAMEKLGKKYVQCTEAEKQMLMLDVAKSIYESSGALGQASREADGYENVMGNLRESWRQFTGILGAPILKVVVPIIQKITGAITGLTQKFSDGVNPAQFLIDKLTALWTWLGNIAAYAQEALQPALNDLQTAITTVKDAVQPFIDKIAEYVSSGQAAENITNAVKAAIDLLAAAYETAKGFVLDVVQGFKDAVEWGKEHETAVKLIAVAIGTFTAAVIANNVATAIQDAGGLARIVWLASMRLQFIASTVAIHAHTAATWLANTATTAWGAAMTFLTSPITWVIAAIGALIAIIIVLAKNWDEIKAKAAEVWDSISQKISAVWEGIKSAVSNAANAVKTGLSNAWESVKTRASNAWNAVKTTVSNAWEGIKTRCSEAAENVKARISNAWNSIKSVTSTVWGGVKSVVGSVWTAIKTNTTNRINEMKNVVSAVFNAIKSIVSTVWEGIKLSITNPIQAAKNTVKGIIDTIKGFFNFSISWPHIPMPHFAISPAGWKIGDLLRGSIPKLSIDWYAKAMDEAMVLSDPTIFGYSPAKGKMLGGGEAGNEVVAGEDHLLNLIGATVEAKTATLNAQIVSLLAEILSAIVDGNGEMLAAVLAGQTIEVNGRELGRTLRQYA